MGFFRVAYVALSAAGGGGNATITGSSTATGTPRLSSAATQSATVTARASSVAYFRVADLTVTQPPAVFFRVADLTVYAARPPSYFRVADLTFNQPPVVRFRVADVTVVAPSQAFVWDGKQWVKSINLSVGGTATTSSTAAGTAKFTPVVQQTVTVTTVASGVADGPFFARQFITGQSQVDAVVVFQADASPGSALVDTSASGVFVAVGTPDTPPDQQPPPVDGGVLYSPPQQVDQYTLVGSIVYKMNVSTTTWKDAAGVWHNARTPSSDDLLGASYVFDRPTVVSPDLAAELSAAGMVTEAT